MNTELSSLALVMAVCSVAIAEPIVLDDFDDVTEWKVITADAVELTITAEQAPGGDGSAMRMDFEFLAGAGYCIAQLPVDLALPENFRFSFDIIAEAPDNNLEFKLLGPKGENVWWVNRRAYAFPSAWTNIRYKQRHFSFAWGPSGGEPLESLSAIEFAIAASSGGKGTVWIDNLVFEPLRPEVPFDGRFALEVHSEGSGSAPVVLRGHDGQAIDAVPKGMPGASWVKIDFGQRRELGAIRFEWEPGTAPNRVDVLIAEPGSTPVQFGTIDRIDGDELWLYLNDRDVQSIILESPEAEVMAPVHRVTSRDAVQVPTTTAFMEWVAADSASGRYPRQLTGRACNWTVVGAPGAIHEALISEHGAIELHKRGPTIEPFLLRSGELLTWSDVEISQSMLDDCLPVPTVTWITGGLTLEVTAMAPFAPDDDHLLIRYRLVNSGSDVESGQLALALRPIQVLPPWQTLNLDGGHAPLRSIAFARNSAVLETVAGEVLVQSLTSPADTIATSFHSGDVTALLGNHLSSVASSAVDEHGLASGAFLYDFTLSPGEETSVLIASPLEPGAAPLPESTDAHALFTEQFDRTHLGWHAQLDRTSVVVPPSAQAISNTIRSSLAYILINQDGPAIQPGSRTYERSWIRDGAMTSAALLRFGHADLVTAYLDWYAEHLFNSGKVPCVVDHRGPDPVDEHDSTGQYIYAVYRCYRITRDLAFLERHYPNVIAGVGYLQRLRLQRMTDRYASGDGIDRACYGLVPESISHEGYSAKPMHSYWDDLFVLRGLKDAAAIAHELGDEARAESFGALASDFRVTLVESMNRAIALHGIDYVPGCVELGDFDATSTAIAYFPVGEANRLPQPALDNTFERYWAFFEDRRHGSIEWTAYTPYELRLIDTFIRRGERDRAMALLGYFMDDRLPAAWNHWAEVVHQDHEAPRFIGDMPHTWVASGFLNSICSAFVYEREDDESLVLAAGLPADWITGPRGVGVSQIQTIYGSISYVLSSADGVVTLALQAPEPPPAGGIWLRLPSELIGNTLTLNEQSAGVIREQLVRIQ